MKFNLQICCDDAAELLRIVGLLSNTTAHVALTPAPTQQQPAPMPTPAPATQPQQQTGPVEHDSAGLPWDERIHAATKAKTAAGKWRYRRGVDDATVASVETELRGAMPVTVEQPAQQQPEQSATPEQLFATMPQQQQPAPMPTPAPVAQQQQPEQAADPLAIPAFLQRPAAPQQQQPAPMPTPAPVAQQAPTLNFQQLMAAISQGLREKKIDQPFLGQLVQHFGLPGIPALASSHAHLIPNVVQELRNRGVV